MMVQLGNLAGACTENFKTYLAMLNWTGLCGLLMPLIGAMSGLGSAHDMKAGILTIILFAFIGLLLGFGMSAACFKIERQSKKIPAGIRPFAYFLIPFVGLVAAYLAPVLLALIILEHK
jgi:hypothetical protein